MDITFFSEGPEHTRFYFPLIKKLHNYNNSLFLITLDSEDPMINKGFFKSVITPKNDFEKIKALKNIESKYLITTTPGIGYSYFPKSKIWPKSNRPKYVYLFHSLVSPNEMYSDNSFKNFDIIFAPSEKIKNQLSYLVSSETKILTSGYLLFDGERKENKELSLLKNILIAPTWGDAGLINDVSLLKKIKNIFESYGYSCTLRPHPMSIKNPELIKSLNNFKLDLAPEVLDFNFYDYLVTDFSGISLEYHFFTKRPSLFINTEKKKKRKLSSLELNLDLIEDEMRNIIGVITDPNQLDESVIPMLKNHMSDENFVDSFHNSSGAADFIASSLQKPAS